MYQRRADSWCTRTVSTGVATCVANRRPPPWCSTTSGRPVLDAEAVDGDAELRRGAWVFSKNSSPVLDVVVAAAPARDHSRAGAVAPRRRPRVYHGSRWRDCSPALVSGDDIGSGAWPRLPRTAAGERKGARARLECRKARRLERGAYTAEAVPPRAPCPLHTTAPAAAQSSRGNKRILDGFACALFGSRAA